ncbi:hypothetical protein [Streptomyces sp. NPDC102487]|uniref:hypothetical protein n=1 Tax=Streptomyces sp. NPDC102487 TaxID=3366182 RepID=UPI003824CDA7
MIIKFLHANDLRSHHANTVACPTIGLPVASWATSKQIEPAGIDQVDRLDILVATWPATRFGRGSSPTTTGPSLALSAAGASRR